MVVWDVRGECFVYCGWWDVLVENEGDEGCVWGFVEYNLVVVWGLVVGYFVRGGRWSVWGIEEW